ncbi:hypothetical protein [Phaeodactylibacter luteus]|uniref:Uncharacterized protein n=1 Tax=Phaeodactylibacter luteus TaxID=1564516 RepID=A0A5C6RJ13_9BACT|nr:hypothetical protein [Phaeodactylibacter luteus]TXB62113.1 hypothetical protein FRY97_15870 [Phaeodactylibacter luteus]
MKYLLTVCFLSSIFASCYVGGISRYSSNHEIDVEEWKKALVSKIKAEKATINDSLSWAKSAFENLEQCIERTDAEKFLLKYDTARHHLGHIPPKASTYFAEYYLQGETSMLHYGMFWIKGNRYQGVWQGEDWKWHDMDTKPKFLKQFVKFKTDLEAEELIHSGGWYIFITEFKDNKIIDVNYVAVLSLPQFLVANKVFSVAQKNKK